MRSYLKLICVLLALSLCLFVLAGCTDDTDNGADSTDNGQQIPDEEGGELDYDEVPENPFENGYNPDGWVP